MWAWLAERCDAVWCISMRCGAFRWQEQHLVHDVKIFPWPNEDFSLSFSQYKSTRKCSAGFPNDHSCTDRRHTCECNNYAHWQWMKDVLPPGRMQTVGEKAKKNIISCRFPNKYSIEMIFFAVHVWPIHLTTLLQYIHNIQSGKKNYSD